MAYLKLLPYCLSGNNDKNYENLSHILIAKSNITVQYYIFILSDSTQKLPFMTVTQIANYHGTLQQVQIVLYWIVGKALIS